MMEDIKTRRSGTVMRYEREPYYYSLLPQTERQVYQELLRAIENFRPRLSLTRWRLTLRDVQRVFCAVSLDHPEIIWLSWQLQVNSVTENWRQRLTSLEFTYTMTPDEARRRMHQVNLAAAPILRQLDVPGLSDWEKVLRLHDLLIHRADYDQAERQRKVIRADNHSIYGTLVKRMAVCEGYAETMTYLLRQLGINCITCMGGEDWDSKKKHIRTHAWNCVTIGGDSMQIDATWDDLGNHLGEMGVSRQYFGLTGREMELCHGFTANFPLPECGRPSLNYFVRRNLVASTMEEVQEIVARAAARRQRVVELRVKNRQLLMEVVNGRDRWDNPLWLPRDCRWIRTYTSYKPNDKIGWFRLELSYTGE